MVAAAVRDVADRIKAEASTAAAISSLTCWDAVEAVSNMDAAAC